MITAIAKGGAMGSGTSYKRQIPVFGTSKAGSKGTETGAFGSIFDGILSGRFYDHDDVTWVVKKPVGETGR